MKGRGLFIVLIPAALVVIGILFFRAGDKSVIETQVDAYSDAKKDLTAVNMKTVSNEVLSFMSSEGRTPADFREMRKLQRVPIAFLDAWGREIRYEKLSDSSFRLTSSGPDGSFDTDDDIEQEY